MSMATAFCGLYGYVLTDSSLLSWKPVIKFQLTKTLQQPYCIAPTSTPQDAS